LEVSGVWRMEFQDRGAIHFHMLLFKMPFWKQREAQKVWEECTREGRSIVDIRLVSGARSVMAYISKYIAKKDDRTEIPSLDDEPYRHATGEPVAGRFWGYINKELLPLGEVVAGVLTDRDTIKSLSSLAWAILGSDNTYNSLSFHLFCDNARWLCERAIEEGGAWLDEWEYTVKDHSMHKQSINYAEKHFSEAEIKASYVPTLGRMFKGERSELVQPLTSVWLERAVFDFSASVAQAFRNEGIIVHIVPLGKGQNHAAV